MDLAGRKVLVTGANRGVGAAFVTCRAEPPGGDRGRRRT